MKKFFTTFGLVLTTLFSFAQSTTVVDIIVNSEDHTLLEAAVVEAGLVEALSATSGTFTVLAPTDAAFTILAEELEVPVEQLLELPNLTDILLYHVLPEVFLEEVLLQSGINSMYSTLLPESPIYFQSIATSIAVNGVASVTVADLVADNGVVHVIDRVVFPTGDPVVDTTTVVAQNGFSNFECLNSNPEAYEIFTAGGSEFSDEVNQALNQFCDSLDNITIPNNDGDDPWNSDEVFIICNGEEIVIDTLELINNPEEFYAYVESLNCAEAEDWFNEDNDTNTPDPGSYFSWDCIYNYPEAGALYGDYGNPEAAAQLEEFCLAVANGEWMWGEDPNEWPITCEEGSSFATVEFETSGIGYEEEISWSLDGYEGGIGLTPVCVNEGCTQFNMFDSWGDGWGGITFTLNTPNGVLLNGTLEDGFVGALGFGINTTEDCSEVSEVENPFGYDIESFEDVFPSIGEINLDSLYPSIEFSENDLLFIIDGSEIDLSLFDENGLNIYPQEVNGYLIFGPFDINDVLTIDINDIADLLISWGFFRPMNDEIISQGTFSKDDPNLPSILSLSSESIMSINEFIFLEENSEYLYSTDILGKRVPADRRGIIIFDKYSSGKVVKRFVK